MSYLLNETDLAQMRADVAQMLPGTAIILTGTRTSNGMGGGSVAWTATGTVACRFDPFDRAVQIEQVAAGEAMRVEYVLTLAYDASITLGQRVRVEGDDYEIRRLSDEHNWRVSRRAVIRRIG